MTSHESAFRTISWEVFLTTELTIDGFGADGDSAHESVKEHKNRLFFGLKTPENCYKSTKTKPQNRFGTSMPQVRTLSLRPHANNPNILFFGEAFGLFVVFEYPNLIARNEHCLRQGFYLSEANVVMSTY